jgi:hypothetical protein
MQKFLADLIKETTATAGTGTVTLAEASGWVRFSDRFSNNDRVYYSIADGINWEVGYGTYVASNQLARTTILGTYVASAWTSGGAAISLSGNAIVRAVAPEKVFTSAWLVEPTAHAVNGAVVVGTSNIVTGSGVTLTLPAAATQGDRAEFIQGAAGITGTIINPNGGKINGATGNMTVDIVDFAFALVYVDSSYGWKVAA